MNQYTQFRARKDEFFQHDTHSPLTPAQQHEFEGLRYFPVDPGLRFELEIDRFPQQDQVQMLTSTGDLRTFTRVGTVSFQVDDQSATLTIFGNQHGFFLPFVDAQAGKETYGAGRYLDPELTSEGKLVLDFNLAYNPYCAYNENYSCPIPPAENRLSVPIRAGERNFP
jgi:uncharacterized protein (DUF1684 family)